MGWTTNQINSIFGAKVSIFSTWNGIQAINFYEYSGLSANAQAHIGVDGLIFGNMGYTYDFMTYDVKKLLHYTNSAYVALNTDYVVNDVTELPYLKFVYEAGIKCIMDTLNLSTAVRYPEAGLHWIVDVNGDLCIAPIGNHNVAGVDSGHIIESVWATTCAYDQEHPLTVGADIIAARFTKKEPEYNFILINGVFQTPPNVSSFAFGSLPNWMGVGEWFSYSSGVDTIVNSGDTVIAPYSIGWYTVDTELTNKMYLDFQTAGLPFIDINLISNAKLTFWMEESNLQTFEIRIYTDLYNVVNPPSDDGAGNYFWTQITPIGTGDPNQGSWERFDLDLGEEGHWNATNDATWSKSIKRIYVRVVGGTNAGYCLISGLNINGQTLRGAYSANVVNSTGGAKMGIINESLVAGWELRPNSPTVSPDALDLLGVSEVLRQMTTPWTGSVQIDLYDDTYGFFNYKLLAGQMMWLNSPAFTPNLKQFRILWYKIVSAADKGATVVVYLTDDLSNAYARDPSNLETLAIKAINPDYQSRDFARLKISGIDSSTPLVKLINVDTL
jgi:hypothetical protein